MTRRSRAREVALQVLYQDDLNPRNNPSIGDGLIQRRLGTDELTAFARDLVAGVRLYRDDLDRLIEETAEHWTVTRMAVTDRNVLRMGAYELLHTTTPAPVAINEAIDLAKRYGSGQSAQFVNGILDRLMHTAGGTEVEETA
jgi:N utilization substance protein B